MINYSPAKYQKLPISSFSPKGWLKKELILQSNAPAGRLDVKEEFGERYPIICDNQWLGGKNEMCNEPNSTYQDAFPMWFQGFVALALIIDDESLKQRLDKMIETLISSQCEDGWVGPVNTWTQNDNEREPFGVFATIMLLTTFTQLTGTKYEDRAVEYVYRAWKKLYEWTDKHSPITWTQMTWSRSLISIYWLYERRPEDWMMELALRLRCQCFDFKTYYADFPHKKPTPRTFWNVISHIVNNVISISQGALTYQMSGDETDKALSYTMMETLEKYHGSALGFINGDENLSGTSNLQGAELCSIVELATSCYLNFAVTGDLAWLDRAESQIYNAFPATCSPDMQTHQYDQQINQVNLMLYQENGVKTDHPTFTSNGGTAALFGLVPNFPCCLYNMGRAWPQFAAQQVMKNNTGLAVLFYAPTVVSTEWNGVPVTINIEGEYPFRESFSLTVTAESKVSFDLELRIPGWTEKALINGVSVNAGTMHTISKEWCGAETININLPHPVRWIERPNNMHVLMRGPLAYSVKIKERWSRITEKIERAPMAHEDHEVFCESKWNYGVADTNVTFTEHPLGELPFSPETPPISATVMCKEIDWPLVNGMAAEQPLSREPLGEAVPVEFIPYGCTNLRLTELPILED